MIMFHCDSPAVALHISARLLLRRSPLDKKKFHISAHSARFMLGDVSHFKCLEARAVTEAIYTFHMVK